MVRQLILILWALALVACSSIPVQTDLEQSNPAVLSLLNKAEAAEAAGQWQIALTYMDQARRIEPRNPYLLYRQAQAYANNGSHEVALQLISRARVLTQSDNRLLKELSELEADILKE